MFVFSELIPANSGKTTVDKRFFMEFNSYYSRTCLSKWLPSANYFSDLISKNMEKKISYLNWVFHDFCDDCKICVSCTHCYY